MPTWRSAPSGPSRQKHSRMSDFILMNLGDRLHDVVLFAKPHYYSRGVTLEGWKHVRTFPSELETYELLCAADVLVTDYSSVMFDFLNANKPIILLDYDRDEYFQTRGSYLDLDELPFQRTKDSYELAELINAVQPDSFGGYAELKERFAPFDSAHAAKEACHLLLDGDFSGYEVIEESAYHNDKKNVLIFAGALQMNGITTSLEGLEQIDPNRANILLTFQAGAGKSVRTSSTAFRRTLTTFPFKVPLISALTRLSPRLVTLGLMRRARGHVRLSAGSTRARRCAVSAASILTLPSTSLDTRRSSFTLLRVSTVTDVSSMYTITSNESMR